MSIQAPAYNYKFFWLTVQLVTFDFEIYRPWLLHTEPIAMSMQQHQATSVCG